MIIDGIPEDGVIKIMENIAKTLSYGPDPVSDIPCQKTGIVIGKVQNGKNSNFITLTALAFDKGYNFVVVPGCTEKPLLTQNRERIRQYFELTKEVLVLDTADYRGEITDSSSLLNMEKGDNHSLKKPCSD